LTISHVGMQLLIYLLGPKYVCAGELVALQALTNVLNYLKVQKITKVCTAGQLAAIKLTLSRQLTEKFGIAKVKKMLKDIVNNCYDRVLEK